MAGVPSKTDIGWFEDADQLGTQQGLGAFDAEKLKRARAIISAFEKRRGAGEFPQLDRQKIADGLNWRLTSPNSFNQGDTFLCGIATFVRVWAFDNPDAYAQLAVDLFEKGEGNLTGFQKGAKTIRPSTALKTCPPGKLADGKEFNHADWIVLASIREAFNSVFDYTNNEGIFRIKAWNFPSDVENEFRAAGYSKVINKADGFRLAGYNLLMEASELYERNWRVILLINSRLLSTKPENTIATPVLNHSNHWIGLNSVINTVISGGKWGVVPFSVYSWDGLYNVPRWNKVVPLDLVLHSYFGFVAGHV